MGVMAERRFGYLDAIFVVCGGKGKVGDLELPSLVCFQSHRVSNTSSSM